MGGRVGGFVLAWPRPCSHPPPAPTAPTPPQVMDLLREILTTRPPPPGGRPWRLLFTGHSLGGALASLAAYDAVQLCRRLPPGAGRGASVLCYTFGAPRPGNHAFARDYRATVPASFDVIHCDDAVTRGGEGGALRVAAQGGAQGKHAGCMAPPRPPFGGARLGVSAVWPCLLAC